MDDAHQQGVDDEADDERLVGQEQVAVSGREARKLNHEAAWAAHNWGWLLGLGIVALVLGIVIASHAFKSLHALIWLSGLFLLFWGVAQLMTLGQGRRPAGAPHCRARDVRRRHRAAGLARGDRAGRRRCRRHHRARLGRRSQHRFLA